jgi:WD40 repeat protein
LILWDAQTFREIRRIAGHTGLIRSVAFLPDSRRAVSSSRDGTIRLWDVENGREVRQFGDHLTDSLWVAVSPNGRSLLSSHADAQELRLWDVDNGKLTWKIHWPAVGQGLHMPTRGSFSPDGVHAVWGTGDGVVRIFRLAHAGESLPTTAPDRKDKGKVLSGHEMDRGKAAEATAG